MGCPPTPYQSPWAPSCRLPDAVGGFYLLSELGSRSWTRPREDKSWGSPRRPWVPTDTTSRPIPLRVRVDLRHKPKVPGVLRRAARSKRLCSPGVYNKTSTAWGKVSPAEGFILCFRVSEVVFGTAVGTEMKCSVSVLFSGKLSALSRSFRRLAPDQSVRHPRPGTPTPRSECGPQARWGRHSHPSWEPV